MQNPYKFKHNSTDQSQFLTHIYLAFSYGKLSISTCLLWTVIGFRKFIHALQPLSSIIGVLIISIFLYSGMPCEWSISNSAMLLLAPSNMKTKTLASTSYNAPQGLNATYALRPQQPTQIGILDDFTPGLDPKATLLRPIQIGLNKTQTGLKKLDTGLSYTSVLLSRFGMDHSAKMVTTLKEVVEGSSIALASIPLQAIATAPNAASATAKSDRPINLDTSENTSHVCCILWGVFVLSILILLNLIKPITQMLALRAVLSTNKETAPRIPISSMALESIESDIKHCKLEAALKRIEQQFSVPNRKIRKEIVLLHYRLNDLRHKQHTNVVNYDYVSIQKSQIAAAIYDLLNSFKQASLEVS